MASLATAEEMAIAQGRGNGDERLLVQFYMGTQKNQQKSREAGRPIVDDVPRVRIMVPGDKHSIIDRPVWDEPGKAECDTARFPRQWAAFKNGVSSDGVQSGTPLDQLPGITKGLVEEMKYFHVHTIEQLAELSDVNAQKFMGAQALKQKARAWLEVANNNAPEKMRAELEQRDSVIAKQAEALAALEARLAAVESAKADEAPKRGPGRPPKHAE